MEITDNPIYIFPSQSMDLVQEKGKGAYGTIYSAKYVLQPEINFIIKRNIIDRIIDFWGSVRELDLLVTLKGHPFIVDLRGISTSSPVRGSPPKIKDRSLREDNLHFIFDQASYDGVTLIRGGFTSSGYMTSAMIQMLLGVEYMHGKGIIHRDLKPANLLWFRHGRDRSLKLCDFGLSKPASQQCPGTPNVITSWYRAPEVIFRHPGYDTQIDMWSAGCVLFEMASKCAFIKGDNEVEIIGKILNSVSEIPTMDLIRRLDQVGYPINQSAFEPRAGVRQLIRTNNTFDDKFIDLLDHLLVIDPQKRYSATKALNHHFFAPYRSYIDQVREMYPPIADPIYPTSILTGPDRSIIVGQAFNIFNHRQEYPWYHHRILFQAVSLFDRYLVHSVSINRHFINDFTLMFMVCIYISIKYFATIKFTVEFQEVMPNQRITSVMKRMGKRFEKHLIIEVLSLKIYRPTLLEMADKYHLILTEEQVRDLLMFYGRLDRQDNIKEDDLFQQFLDTHPDLRTTSRIFRPDVPRLPGASFHVGSNPPVDNKVEVGVTYQNNVVSQYVPTYHRDIAINVPATTTVPMTKIGKVTERGNPSMANGFVHHQGIRLNGRALMVK